MSDFEARQRQRRMRASVLRTLDVAYGHSPDTVEYRSIRRVVRQGSDQELDQTLQFLVDMGYAATVRGDALDNGPANLYRLTGQGKRVLNGDVEDKSIEFE
jgi:hypothetical protein